MLLITMLLPMIISLPSPESQSEGRANTNGLIQIDHTYILPLLLAGAAFAKVKWVIFIHENYLKISSLSQGYLFGHLKKTHGIADYGYAYYDRNYRTYNPHNYYYDYYGRRIGNGKLKKTMKES